MLKGQQISLQRRSLGEQVFHEVKRMILSEELRGGERIQEERIARAFGVSRTPIREALRKLEKVGLVRIVPHSHAEVVRLDPVDAGHIGEVRLHLECLAVRRLAGTASDADIAELRRLEALCSASARGTDIAAVFEADNGLHLEIARRCGNPYVREILQDLSVKINLLRTTTCVRLSDIRRHVRWHARIVQAIEAHDPEGAEAAMRDHIVEASSALGEGRADRPRRGRAQGTAGGGRGS